MLTSVLLALPPPDGRTPPWALAVDGEPVLHRLARQLGRHGRVVVLGGPSAASVEAAASDTEFVEVDGPAGVAAWLAAAPDDLLVVRADVVTPDLAVERVADDAAAGTWALLGPLDGARAGLARVARGKVTAATSAYHRIGHATHASRGALRIAANDVATFRSVASEVAGLLAEVPAPLREELDRKRAGGDLGAPAVQLREPVGIDELCADVVALLLVGMVRRGLDVTAMGLPSGLPWVQPRSVSDAAAAAELLRDVDEERIRLDAAVKEQDGFFTTFFVSTYSRYWARWCARRGFTPDQVTSVSMLLGIAAAVAFGAGQRWAAVTGAVLLQVAFTLDCVDGQLARYTRRGTALGAWLDSIFDRGKEYVVYAGLAVGGIRAGDAAVLWVLAAAALSLQTFRHALDFGYAARQLEDLAEVGVAPLTQAEEPGAAHWEALPIASAPPGRSRGSIVRRLALRTIALLRSAEAVPGLKWLKRIVVLPIGERFAVISVVTAVATPRATFVVLLVWGTLATTYTFGGRLVRSVS